MRTAIITIMLLFISIGIAGAVNQPQTSGLLKGYVTFGDQVVMLPDLLKTGDRIIISDLLGRNIFFKTVENGGIRLVGLGLPAGVYSVKILRGRNIFKSANLPYAGQ
jgi:hypothetical protein